MRWIWIMLSVLIAGAGIYLGIVSVKSTVKRGVQNVVETIGGNNVEHTVRLEGNVKLNKGSHLNIYIQNCNGKIIAKKDSIELGELMDTSYIKVVIDSSSSDTIK